MSPAIFPVTKLLVLAAKQMSKPIVLLCVREAKRHPIFRRFICSPPAQFYHWCEVKMKMWILNLGKPVNIPVLNEQQAIELGANLLGEGVIFTIAALILISEYNRSSAKEAKKEAAIKAEKQALEQSIHELYFTTQKQATQINELMRLIYHLDGKIHSKQSQPLVTGQDQPPPGAASQIKQTETQQNNNNHLEECSSHNNQIIQYTVYNLNNSLLSCAYEFVENDMFAHEQRSTSIVNLAIEHLFNNVYRIPMSS